VLFPSREAHSLSLFVFPADGRTEKYSRCHVVADGAEEQSDSTHADRQNSPEGLIMSRDFLLVLGGGVVSLVTTLVVLFISDLAYRRDQARESKAEHKQAPPQTGEKESTT
jgi:hypothetical protein